MKLHKCCIILRMYLLFNNVLLPAIKVTLVTARKLQI